MLRRRVIQLGALSLLWPGLVVAQERLGRRVGVLICTTPEDPAGLGFVRACSDGLREEAWIEGVNLTLDVRYSSGLRDASRAAASELLALRPDAILCALSVNAEETVRLTSTDPIVFVGVADPGRSGLVQSFRRPGRNATGLTSFEPSHGGKWLSLLREIAPAVRRVKFIYHPDPRGSAYAYFPFMQDAAAQFGMEVVTVHVREQAEIASALVPTGSPEENGAIAGFDGFILSNRALFLSAVDANRIAAIYPFTEYADEGGLISYALDLDAEFRSAGAIVGRILHGAPVSDIPVQNTSRFVLSVNLKSAVTSGINVPIGLLARADRIIE